MKTTVFFSLLSCLLLGVSPADGKIKSEGKPASPLPVKIKLDLSFTYTDSSFYNDELITEEEEKEVANIASTIENNVADRENRRSMLHFMRVLTIKKAFRNKRQKAKIFADMANISARMKLYPLAMQFTAKEMQENYAAAAAGDTTEMTREETEVPGINSIKEEKNTEDSEPVSVDDILHSFDDHKEASDYALIVHVKQPVNRKRKSFTGIDNVGHMFVTLIKYNTDKTYVSRSFGFYPDKKTFLSGTPFRPTAPPVIKDDTQHDWDAAVGKFISYRRFKKIIKLLCRYEYKMYNLNENNCTDFGLAIASLSGIQIDETKGSWPFGKGNNPANAGQSILEDKITDKDQDAEEGIFIFKK